MIEENNPEINVDELMQKIREEVAQRYSHTQAKGIISKPDVSNSTVIYNSIFNHIEALLRNAESRAYSRTKWPDNLNKFPFNLTKIFNKFALKILNLLFKDQREVNFNLLRAFKESVALNRQLIEKITSLRAHMDEHQSAVDNRLQKLDARLDTVYSRVPTIDDKLNKIDTCINSWMTATEERLHAVNSQDKLIDERLSTADTRLQEVDERLSTAATRLEGMDERYFRNDSYLKNDLVQQKRLITIFLEEARRRLPESFNQEQLQTFVNEEQHLLDAFYVAFEDQFRGSREDILNRSKVYLPLIEEAKVGTADLPIVDVGCGRGEWLELLYQSGYTARGIDINRVMVEQCRARGLEVMESDVIAYLQSLPDASLGTVTGFHIIEHLPFPVLMKLVDETVRVLHSGGLAIFETPNPENIVVGACNFYSDPTHRNPLFPPTVKFLFEQRGFLDVKLLRLNEHRGEESLQFVEADNPIASKINPLIEIAKFNFYASPDFAVIAKKA